MLSISKGVGKNKCRSLQQSKCPKTLLPDAKLFFATTIRQTMSFHEYLSTIRGTALDHLSVLHVAKMYCH